MAEEAKKEKKERKKMNISKTILILVGVIVASVVIVLAYGLFTDQIFN